MKKWIIILLSLIIVSAGAIIAYNLLSDEADEEPLPDPTVILYNNAYYQIKSDSSPSPDAVGEFITHLSVDKSNTFIPTNEKTSKALLKNLELFGAKNAVIVSEPPAKLAERFTGYFDKILVDAPCSGEGMFRKSPAIMKNWEQYGVEYYQKLQREILPSAVKMLRPGGMLLYSTCTFSPAIIPAASIKSSSIVMLPI